MRGDDVLHDNSLSWVSWVSWVSGVLWILPSLHSSFPELSLNSSQQYRSVHYINKRQIRDKLLKKAAVRRTAAQDFCLLSIPATTTTTTRTIIASSSTASSRWNGYSSSEVNSGKLLCEVTLVLCSPLLRVDNSGKPLCECQRFLTNSIVYSADISYFQTTDNQWLRPSFDVPGISNTSSLSDIHLLWSTCREFLELMVLRSYPALCNNAPSYCSCCTRSGTG